MNDDLTPEARALVEAARPLDRSDSYDRIRIRRSLAATLGVSTAGMAASSTAVAASASGGAMVMKVIVIAGLVVSVGTVAVVRPWEQEARTDRSVRPVAVEQLQAVQTVARTVTDPADAPLAEPAIPLPSTDRNEPRRAERLPPLRTNFVVEAPRESSELQRPQETLSSLSATGSATTPDTPATMLAEELAELREAQRALHDNDPGAALAAMDALATRAPLGAMALERDATRVLSLCALGRRQEAEALAHAIVVDHPGSPLAARMRSPCRDMP